MKLNWIYKTYRVQNVPSTFQNRFFLFLSCSPPLQPELSPFLYLSPSSLPSLLNWKIKDYTLHVSNKSSFPKHYHILNISWAYLGEIYMRSQLISLLNHVTGIRLLIKWSHAHSLLKSTCLMYVSLSHLKTINTCLRD